MASRFVKNSWRFFAKKLKILCSSDDPILIVQILLACGTITNFNYI